MSELTCGVDAVAFYAPEVADSLAALQRTAWQSVEAAELELCRLRICDLLGDEDGLRRREPAALAAGFSEHRVAHLAQWRRSSAFTPRERARLDYTEQCVVSVGGIVDAQIDALLAHDDAVRVYEFTMAVYVLEMSVRVGLVTRATFKEEA